MQKRKMALKRELESLDFWRLHLILLVVRYMQLAEWLHDYVYGSAPRMAHYVGNEATSPRKPSA